MFRFRVRCGVCLFSLVPLPHPHFLPLSFLARSKSSSGHLSPLTQSQQQGFRLVASVGAINHISNCDFQYHLPFAYLSLRTEWLVVDVISIYEKHPLWKSPFASLLLLAKKTRNLFLKAFKTQKPPWLPQLLVSHFPPLMAVSFPPEDQMNPSKRNLQHVFHSCCSLRWFDCGGSRGGLQGSFLEAEVRMVHSMTCSETFSAFVTYLDFFAALLDASNVALFFFSISAKREFMFFKLFCAPADCSGKGGKPLGTPSLGSFHCCVGRKIFKKKKSRLWSYSRR